MRADTRIRFRRISRAKRWPAAFARLDEVLGPDLDAPASADDPGMIERGTDAAGNEAVNVIQGAAEDVVPFRRWVRKLTGAERYSKKVAASIVAGTVQRSFLKGIAVARGCGSPWTSAP